MPLSDPVPRDPVHRREITCRGFLRKDGLWDIEALLVDTKAYAFANKDRGTIQAGEPVHKMWVRLTIDEDMTVRRAEAATDAGPFAVCGDITPVFGKLEGLVIRPGWRRAVLELMGGTKGCTHLTDLLVGPLAVTAQQTIAAARERRHGARSGRERPAVLDTCHALTSDGPVVKRDWPDFYTGP